MKILFVCSLGRMRSRTAAEYLANDHHEHRFSGTHVEADVPITRELVDWADTIVCMERGHRDKLRRKFKGVSNKVRVWGIPDEYAYGDPELVARVQRLYAHHFCAEPEQRNQEAPAVQPFGR